MDRRELMAGLAAAGAMAPARGFAADDGLRAVARDAWLFGLPLIEMATTRARNLAGPLARLNRFSHARQLSGPQSRAVTAPNNDTLYSSAWLDLTQGPLTLTVPRTGERYISIAGMSMYSDNDILLGTRVNGGAGGTYVIAGPGQAARGRNVVRLSTPHGWLLARTLVSGPEDLPAVRAVQEGLKLDGPAGAPPPAYAGRQADALSYFVAMGDLLASDPPPARDAAMMRRIGALTNVRAARFSADGMRDIEAGVEDARRLVRTNEGMTPIQGWNYPRPNLGNFGTDYRFRAAVALAGLASLPPAEAMYMHPVGDRGRMFTGAGPYRLHFPPGGTPPVDGFWSLTMYEATPDGQFFLVENPARRYSIGDRTPGLRRNRDGSLDIWIARSDPGREYSANWLPAPATGPFTLSMRAYLPRKALRNGRYRLPPIRAV